MRDRDIKGRYVRAANDVLNFLEFIYMTIKIISIAFILYLIVSYFDFSESFKKFIIKFIFGNTCKICCEADNNGVFK